MIYKYLASEGDLLKLGRLYDIQYLFEFIEEHNLLGTVDLRPIPG